MLDLRPHRCLARLRRTVGAGLRSEFGLAGRDPKLDFRQVRIIGDVRAPLGSLLAGVGIDDLVIGPHEMGDLVQVAGTGCVLHGR